MIDKKKLFKSLLIIVLLIVIIFATVQIRKTLARYETTATTERDVDVAFWVVDNSFQTRKITLNVDGEEDKLYPRNEPYEYTFTVSNFDNNGTETEDDDKIAETDIAYEIVLTATTNLPLQYQIIRQINGVTKTETLNQKLVTDTNGTVYREMSFATDTNPYPLEMNTINDTTYEKAKITDTYILQITFPVQSYVNGELVTNNANLEYPDLMEDIKIDISAIQKIETDNFS